MKATLVSLTPSTEAAKANRPALTPELLAAVMARYSRNNEGLESILQKIDTSNPDKSVDSIFRMVDYGHQSIADMAPVGMFLDGVTIWAAYVIWSLCPTRVDLPVCSHDLDCGEDEMLGGQESSTRYIKMSLDGVPLMDDLGIRPNDYDTMVPWRVRVESLFEGYQAALAYWERIAKEKPEILRIPSALLQDTSPKAVKQVERMRRNYAFDRARYYLPVAATTNMAMVMPARTWASLCQYLLSSPLLELRNIGEAVRSELKLASPNLLRHAVFKPSIAGLWLDMMETDSKTARNLTIDMVEAKCSARLEAMEPSWSDYFASDLLRHENRYAPIGDGLRMTMVRFGWSAVSLAEIRDLNRHRTGQKYCPPIPLGFYSAEDQKVEGYGLFYHHSGHDTCQEALRLLRERNPRYVYWLPLGAQFAFEHVTTADKFLYEAELRTGTGAHFRYAQHLRDVLKIWYDLHPETKGLVLEGSAEPE